MYKAKKYEPFNLVTIEDMSKLKFELGHLAKGLCQLKYLEDAKKNFTASCREYGKETMQYH